MREAAIPSFEAPRALPRWLPYAVAGVLLAALAWFVYQQLSAVHGIKVEAPSPQVVSMLPPPPPPPPPPPEPVEKPPEPTEQPQPVPDQAPQSPKPEPQAAPVTMAAEAQAGTDSFGIAAGSGGGIGAPGGGGTCLGTKCGAGSGGGGGMSIALYRSYLSSALQRRVSDDERLNRLAFAADLQLMVDGQGRVTGAKLVEARGRDDSATLRRLVELLTSVRLDPPPPAMAFPYKITVRGRRPL